MSDTQICARCHKELPLSCYEHYQTPKDKAAGAWRYRLTCTACIKAVAANYYRRVRKYKNEAERQAVAAVPRDIARILKRWGWLYRRWN